jgi:hypothetical protein
MMWPPQADAFATLRRAQAVRDAEHLQPCVSKQNVRTESVEEA